MTTKTGTWADRRREAHSAWLDSSKAELARLSSLPPDRRAKATEFARETLTDADYRAFIASLVDDSRRQGARDALVTRAAVATASMASLGKRAMSRMAAISKSAAAAIWTKADQQDKPKVATYQDKTPVETRKDRLLRVVAPWAALPGAVIASAIGEAWLSAPAWADPVRWREAAGALGAAYVWAGLLSFGASGPAARNAVKILAVLQGLAAISPAWRLATGIVVPVWQTAAAHGGVGGALSAAMAGVDPYCLAVVVVALIVARTAWGRSR